MEKKAFVGCCANCGWQTVRGLLFASSLSESFSVIFGLNRFADETLEIRTVYRRAQKESFLNSPEKVVTFLNNYTRIRCASQVNDSKSLHFLSLFENSFVN